MKQLFINRKIDDLTSSYVSSLESETQKLTRSDFDNSTIEELIEKIRSDFEIKIPELEKDDIYTKKPKDIKISIGNRGIYGGGTNKIDGTEFVFVIPFKGDSYYFGITPTQFLRVVPYGNAVNNEITISYEVPNGKDASGLRAEFDKNLAIIEKYLNFLESDFERFNSLLPKAIKPLLERRKAKLDNDDETASGFGFPVK